MLGPCLVLLVFHDENAAESKMIRPPRIKQRRRTIYQGGVRMPILLIIPLMVRTRYGATRLRLLRHEANVRLRSRIFKPNFPACN